MMDHDELMAMATKTICELNTLTDAQAQELQSARAENAELEELLHNRAKYAAGLRAEIKRLREALSAMLQAAIDGDYSYDEQGHSWPEIVEAHAALEATE